MGHGNLFTVHNSYLAYQYFIYILAQSHRARGGVENLQMAKLSCWTDNSKGISNTINSNVSLWVHVVHLFSCFQSLVHERFSNMRNTTCMCSY